MNTIQKPHTIGDITIYNVTPLRGSDSFLFVCNDVTFLYDTGFDFCSQTLYDNIKAVLNDRPLDYILLTHSHYDHALGSAYLSKMYPDVKVVASSYAAKIMLKESARNVMRRLDRAAASDHGIEVIEDNIDSLHADIAVEDGDILMLGNRKVQVIALPGHTRDSVAYYFEDMKLMLSVETIGITVEEHLVMPSFLVGYQMSLDSIAKIQNFDIKYYFIPHTGIIEGDEIKDFFIDTVKGHKLGHDLIVSSFKEGKTHEEIFQIIEDTFYTPEAQIIYPKSAFAENTNIQIPMILREEGLME